MLTSISRTVDSWIAIMSTGDFWAIFAVGATAIGFLLAAGIMMTNFDMLRMRSCFNASNLNSYLMFNILMFFALGGALALGEVFNYFDDKRRNIPHKRGSLFWLLIITVSLGSGGLIMLKSSC